MKRIFTDILLCLSLLLGLTSCWKEEYPLAGVMRYRVENLVGVPGDSEAALSWTFREDKGVVDFLVSYNDENSRKVSLYTGAETECIVMGLQNGFNYEFSVQAVYPGDILSGVSSVKVTPTTERLAVKDVLTDSGNNYVRLLWTVPSTNVIYYLIRYHKDGDSDQTEILVDGSLSEDTLSGHENDITYYFTIIAHYAKGDSDEVLVKDMPAFAMPYSFSPETAASDQPVTFRFNRSDFPTATAVKWTFPDGKSLDGDEVASAFNIGNTEVDSNEAQIFKVQLEANVGGVLKKWTFDVPVTPFVFIKTDWETGSKPQGFKGSAPVLSPDGKTVYVVTFESPAGLYAVDTATGKERWRHVISPATGAYNGCTVNPVTGDIYFGSSASGLIALTSDGNVKWTSKDVGVMKQTSFPAVSADGNTVFAHDASGKVTAINAVTGAKKWQTSVAGKGGGLLVNADELIVGCYAMEKAVAFLNSSDGSVISTVDLPDNMSDASGFAVSGDRKTAYLGTVTGMICAIDLQTRALKGRVSTPRDESDNCNVWELCVSPSGDVFGGNKRGYTFCYAADLTLKWQGNALATVGNAFNYGHPCCDAQGRFIIGSGGKKNQNFLYNPDGTFTKWSVLASDDQKQMAGNAYHNGVFYSVYIGGASGNGALVAKYVGGEDAQSGWPCHGGDICGSCCIK